MVQDNIDTRKQDAMRKAVDVLGTSPDIFTNPLTVLASPAWRGIEGDIWRAIGAERAIVLKHYHPDTSFYVDTPAAIEAATQAGELGIGPAVVKKWVGDGIFAMNDLGSDWLAGGLQDTVDPDIRANVIAQKKLFQSGAKLEKYADVFSEIEALLLIVKRENIFAHRDVGIFQSYFGDAQTKLGSLDRDTKPCHRDGNTANLMIGPGNAVQLLDFDFAANCDPFEDVGCYLAEFFESEADARSGFEEWYGTFDEGLFQRSMIYGLADDMRWGLISAIMAAKSPRSTLEFSKYSAWRFLRLEAHAKRSNANDRIRAAA